MYFLFPSSQKYCLETVAYFVHFGILRGYLALYSVLLMSDCIWQNDCPIMKLISKMQTPFRHKLLIIHNLLSFTIQILQLSLFLSIIINTCQISVEYTQFNGPRMQNCFSFFIILLLYCFIILLLYCCYDIVVFTKVLTTYFS
jgi:hypothetical protein